MTTMRKLYEKYGAPEYVKIDIEGADGICLDQLLILTKGSSSAARLLPRYLTFECNSLAWIDKAVALGYGYFKLVPQSRFMCKGGGGGRGDDDGDEEKDLKWRHRLWHSGPPAEESLGADGTGAWRSADFIKTQIRSRFCIHSEGEVGCFLKGPRPFVEHDFAVLQSSFPIESRDEEQWYDVHAKLHA